MFDARDRADFPLTLLWRRGDTLACAVDRLHAIMIDETAARAPRHGMLEGCNFSVAAVTRHDAGQSC